MTTLLAVTAVGAAVMAAIVRIGWLDRLTGGPGTPTTWRTAIGNTAGAVIGWALVAVVLASCHAPLPKGWL